MDGSLPKGCVAFSNPYQTLDDLFSFSDISETMNYDAAKLRNFDPSSLCGLNDFPQNKNAESENVQPVFHARLYLAQTGYFLCIRVHHSTTDITGLGILLRIWASHCKMARSGAVVRMKSLNRRAPFWEANKKASIDLPALLHYKIPGVQENVSGTDIVTSIFTFSNQELSILKAEVTRGTSSTNGTGWVSKGDILTAILWSSVVSTELSYPDSPIATSKATEGKIHSIRIPVNLRRHYAPHLAMEFMGAAFGVSSATADETDLLDIALCEDNELFLPALARVSGAIREAISNVNAQSMDDVIQFLAAQSDITNLKFGPGDANISIVSWADQDVYGLDWGPEIGLCDAVRLPRLQKKRYPIVLPRLLNCNLEVLVSFEKHFMDRFKLTKVMKSIGANFV
jgi:hypothetical protein